jgi:predicted nucleic acid-binding protein
VNLVVDTSVILAVLTNEPERTHIVRLTQDANLLAPASVHWEVGNALSAMIKRKRLTPIGAQSAIQSYGKIPIRFIEVGLKESVAIASKHNLYAYDAYVIACAQSERCELISLDTALLQAAIAAGVGIIEVP